ncbi:MAG TPA: Gfo/Idh/MocA family oxidoreductase [Opitutus sp.]|nr:Gfo/Idh/MocA family oxidoreductase [Opitutus sp.]
MAKKRYVLVGTGVRATNFIEPLAHRFRNHSELVALCDVSPTRLAYHNEQLVSALGHPAVPAYAARQFDRMIEELKPDCVIVTSKDSTHHDYIVRALRHGCDVISEKPMTVDAEKTRLILETAAQTDRQVQVTFNLRWSPHRTKVRELIAAGTIGRVRNVHLEYLINTDHGADYYRRWHATMADSGGLLVHKSTHHFDLVNWWIDAIPEQVFAFGRLDFYGRTNAVARGDGRLAAYARYTGESEAAHDPFALDLRHNEQFAKLYLDAEADSGYVRDRNVFRDGIDIYDNMSVLVRYRGGAQLNYSLLSFSPREGMRVSVNGDRGRIEYATFQPTHLWANGDGPAPASASDQPGESLHVYPLFQPSYEVKVDKLDGNHDGSDLLLTEQLFSATPPPDPFQRRAGHEQAAASVLIGVAANESIRQNKVIDVADLAPLNPAATRLTELV